MYFWEVVLEVVKYLKGNIFSIPSIHYIVSQFQGGKKRNWDWEHIFEVTAEWKIFWDNRVSKDPVCVSQSHGQAGAVSCFFAFLSIICQFAVLSFSSLQAGSCFVLLSYCFVVLLFRTFLSFSKSRDGSCWTLVVTSHCGNGSASWPNAQKK